MEKLFLQVIQSYCEKQKLSSKIHSKIHKQHKQKPARENPSETRRVSLDLFRQGKSVREIATIRNFVDSTIEGHLASFIQTGEVDIHELIPETKLMAILDVVKQVGGNAAWPVKEKLGEDYSFGEIRTVMNYHQWMQAKEV